MKNITMKKIILSIVLIISLSLISFGQVGIGTTSPDASSALDISSVTKGFLLPRMTEAQMNVIASPAEGLMVYCLDCSPKGFYINDGSVFYSLLSGEISLSTAALAEVLEDSPSTGGASNANGVAVTYTELEATGVTGLVAGNIVAYQAAIALEPGFSNPVTVSELQSLIDAVNVSETVVAALAEVLEDSPSTGGASNANGTAVTYIELEATGVTGLETGNIVAYQTAIALESGFSNPILVSELQSLIDVVNSTDTGTVVVDVTGTDGRVWMDRNLGATQVATSSTDANSYGDLYQWGRAKDGHESRTSAATVTTVTSANPNHGDFIKTTDTTDYNWTDFAEEDGLWQSGLNDPCPSGYRVPTEAELNEERINFNTNDAVGAFTSPLKLPVSGGRSRAVDGTLYNVDLYGLYWSSTLSGVDARRLYFSDASIVAAMSTNTRSMGFSVRCIKE